MLSICLLALAVPALALAVRSSSDPSHVATNLAETLPQHPNPTAFNATGALTDAQQDVNSTWAMNLDTSNVHCGWPFATGDSHMIKQLGWQLGNTGGYMSVAAGACIRLQCQDTSAIYVRDSPYARDPLFN
jgi:hypothetical protein